MGGICGFIGKRCLSENELMRMSEEIAHRGTQNNYGQAVYQLDSAYYAGLSYRRLAIKGKGEELNLPVCSPDKSVSVILDGEIYNYREIRELIKDYPFQTNNDAEVIIAAYLKWGIQFLKKVNGMFAIALLDRKNNVLYLMRDRMGEKPLYYYVNAQNDILFASQPRAFLACDQFVKEINSEVLGTYFLHTCIEAPNTIYKNVYKLGHGCILEIRNGEIQLRKYWDVARKYKKMSQYEIKDYEKAKKGTENILTQAIRIRMEEDQPIGFCLSGGYDSALVCALAQNISSTPIKTYTIGVYDDSLNEAVYAKRIAKHLGTDHTELYIDEEQMLSLLEEIPDYYDEPFADSSQLPTMLLSSLARKDVALILTGIGGDELYGGLDIYEIVREAQQKADIGKVLYLLKKAPLLKQMKIWGRLPIEYRIISDEMNPETQTQAGVNQYIKCIKNILKEEPAVFHYEIESHYREKDWGVRRMLLDLDTFTIYDELTKQDRGSMRYGLESRSPFYDKDVIEYSFRIPIDFKVNKLERKMILKDIVHQYIPREIMDRKKMGFCIPQDKWLRGPLKEKVMDYTNRDFLKRQGIFNPDETIRLINTYMKTGDQGKWSGANFSKIVWPYFIFQQWYERYKNV